MKKLLLLCALFGAFYGHGRFTFSEPRVAAWLTSNSAKALSGDSAACDAYTADATVNLRAEGARGTWEVEGGKDEICGYLKQVSAALTLTRASTSTEFTDLVVVRSGFPWLQAEVSYQEKATIQVLGRSVTATSDDTLVLVRTFSGLKIKSVESNSTGGL
jgi:hypothetical protein